MQRLKFVAIQQIYCNKNSIVAISCTYCNNLYVVVIFLVAEDCFPTSGNCIFKSPRTRRGSSTEGTFMLHLWRMYLVPSLSTRVARRKHGFLTCWFLEPHCFVTSQLFICFGIWEKRRPPNARNTDCLFLLSQVGTSGTVLTNSCSLATEEIDKLKKGPRPSYFFDVLDENVLNSCEGQNLWVISILLDNIVLRSS